MVHSCVACRNQCDIRNTLPFHTFPFNRPKILRLWVQAIRRENWFPSKASRLCGAHFLPTDYQLRLDLSKRFLKPNAVPSVFESPSNLLKKAALPRRKIIKHATETREIVRTTTFNGTTETITDSKTDRTAQFGEALAAKEQKKIQQLENEVVSSSPKVQDVVNERLKAIKKQNLETKKPTVIASQHGIENDGNIIPSLDRKILRENSIPTTFQNVPSHSHLRIEKSQLTPGIEKSQLTPGIEKSQLTPGIEKSQLTPGIEKSQPTLQGPRLSEQVGKDELITSDIISMYQTENVFDLISLSNKDQETLKRVEEEPGPAAPERKRVVVVEDHNCQQVSVLDMIETTKDQWTQTNCMDSSHIKSYRRQIKSLRQNIIRKDRKIEKLEGLIEALKNRIGESQFDDVEIEFEF